MRMVGLLIALAIVGMVAYKQLGGSASGPANAPVISGISTPAENTAPPRIPTHPGGISEFDAAMDGYMDMQATTRMQEVETQFRQTAEPERN